VTAHELGHFAMYSVGVWPGEASQHCVGVPTMPGQAWGEGYATWFAADARTDPLYVDKSGGTFFWFDIGSRDTSYGSPIAHAVASAGLEQEIDENDVAAMLWALSADGGLTHDPLDVAVASPRMTVSPFARGYTAHSWTMDGCDRTDVTDTGVSAPYLADFLDALRCAGTPKATIDAVTEPSVHYPYPSSAPLCDKPPPPLVARFASDDPADLRLVIERRGRWVYPITVELQLPPGALLLAGQRRTWLPADPTPGEDELRWIVAGAAPGSLAAIVDSQGPAAGASAEVRGVPRN
jgi:hypothetical protein